MHDIDSGKVLEHAKQACTKYYKSIIGNLQTLQKEFEILKNSKTQSSEYHDDLYVYHE